MNPAFAREARRLEAFRNRHEGERCVIIGNGPSLRKMDLSFLKDETTFGLNRIHLLFETVDFRPTYFVCVNPLVLEQSAQDIERLSCPKFVSEAGRRFVRKDYQTYFLRSLYEWIFSKNPANGVNEGYTVTYVAMQLAWFMGFREVALIGVDHYFSTKGPANMEVTSSGEDPNHFHPEYFGKGFKWHLPDLMKSEKAYELAKSSFLESGRRIVDCTYGGKLGIFEKQDYVSYFAKSKNVTWLSGSRMACSDFRVLRGEDLLESGNLSEAEGLFSEVLADIPEHPGALNNLAVIRWGQGASEEARSLILRALRAEPAYRDALVNLASVGSDFLDDVVSEFIRATSLDDKDLMQAIRSGMRRCS